MQASDLLSDLGYASSSNCLRADTLEHAPDFGHVFRRAKESFDLEAVYCLRSPQPDEEMANAIIPVTYVCKATSFEAADEIHRLVWNQNVVPFLIVLAPQGVRVYTGFEHAPKSSRSRTAECLVEASFAEVVEKLSEFSAGSIDSGTIWDRWGDRIRPQQRVEWRLLEDLRKLEVVMTKTGLTNSSLIHTLIGKFVYLYYLRHRKILSDPRLGQWNLSWDDVAGRSAKLASFAKLCDRLDEWLNGSVFPLNSRDLREIGATVIQRVAAVFAGDSPSGQMHFGFEAYDFSHIPIETLSVIYEQFLHLRDTQSGSTVGKERAAYYTPIPVVNFIIDRMDEIRPLRPGMRVLDAACGSGAFLVQCYRKLVEDRWRAAPQRKPLRPTALRDLLVKHVFGMDVDAEACRVAELSLILTLLDYVDPPDLTTTNFKLPSLSGTNIIEANAFDDANEFVVQATAEGFDWLIGNPPWKELKAQTTSEVDLPVLQWMRQHKETMATGGNQIAEAFAWRTSAFAARQAIAGLLMPAMTLFKRESQRFRQKFFAANPLVYLANFANLAEVLFAGKPKTLGGHSRVPAAALIFRPSGEPDATDAARRIPVFSPLVANQEATRPRRSDKRTASWSIIVDEGEVRAVDAGDVLNGDALTFKLAAWGSHVDQKLLRRLSRLETLGAISEANGFTVSEGLPLRKLSRDGGHLLVNRPELAGRAKLLTLKLTGMERLFSFPSLAIGKVAADETWVPKRSGYARPESLCRPPHILVSAARNWAIFSDEYLVVPARQIGIAGDLRQTTLLRAITAYLNSDFFQYHQFFMSTQSGVKREVSTLAALLRLPVPPDLARQDSAVVTQLASLQEKLADIERRSPASTNAHKERQAVLITELNEITNEMLGLRLAQAARVSDFVNVMMGLRDGKVEPRAVASPTEEERHDYATSLKRELDAFVGSEAKAKHSVAVWSSDREGVIQVDLSANKGSVTVHPRSNGTGVVSQGAELRRKLESHFSQWRYFNRNLRVFAKDQDRVFLFKPMQRFHWLRSQAVLDAGEIISLVLDHSGAIE